MMTDLLKTDTKREAGTLAIVAAMLGVFICLLDVNVVNVALPDIQRDLSGTLLDSQWVVNLYILALAALIIPAGVLGDVFNVRWVYAAAVAVFGLASVLCGNAGSFGDSAMAVLHIGRFLQGLGGAFVLPLSLALIFSYAPSGSVAKLVGVWGAVSGLSTAIGPLVGGLLADHAGWEWIFFLNVPIAVVIIALMLRSASPERAARQRRIPIISAAVVGLGFFALTLALTEGPTWGWGSFRVIGLLVAFVLLIGVVVVYEMRQSEPLVPRYLVRFRGFQLSVLSGLAIGAGAFSMFFFISYYLQFAGHLSATATGVLFLPMSAALVVFAPLGARFVAKLGVYRTIGIGLAVAAVGVVMVGFVELTGSDPAVNSIILPTVIVGVGIGIAFPSVSAQTVQSAQPVDLGVASSAGTMARQVGNALGVAVFGVILGHYFEASGGDVAQMATGMKVLGIAAGAVLLAAAAGNLVVAATEKAPQ